MTISFTICKTILFSEWIFSTTTLENWTIVCWFFLQAYTVFDWHINHYKIFFKKIPMIFFVIRHLICVSIEPCMNPNRIHPFHIYIRRNNFWNNMLSSKRLPTKAPTKFWTLGDANIADLHTGQCEKIWKIRGPIITTARKGVLKEMNQNRNIYATIYLYIYNVYK